MYLAIAAASGNWNVILIVVNKNAIRKNGALNLNVKSFLTRRGGFFIVKNLIQEDLIFSLTGALDLVHYFRHFVSNISRALYDMNTAFSMIFILAAAVSSAPPTMAPA